MPPFTPERDRRRPLRHAFVWLPAGLWTGSLLVGLVVALELAMRHRVVGTATREEAAIFAWETLRDLPSLAWSAVVAGLLVAALAFRFGRGPVGRATVTILGALLATGGVAARALLAERLDGRLELALDAPLVLGLVALIPVAAAVRVVDAGARFAGPLEDAPALLRPFLGGGAAAGGVLALALVVGLPALLATPPARVVVLALRDLRLAPGSIRYADATGVASPSAGPLAPAPYGHGASESRPALRCTPPATLAFPVVEGASHLVAEFGVDGRVQRELGPGSVLTFRCDVLLDGTVALREEVRVTPPGEFAAGGLDAGEWHRVGGPAGVSIAGVGEVELRLEAVGPRSSEKRSSEILDAELVAAGPTVGFSPLVQVLRRRERFAAPTRTRPSLVAVRLARGMDAPPGTWAIDLPGGPFATQLPELATELLGAGAATAAFGRGPAPEHDGFEVRLADRADLARWLEGHAGLRSFLWIDLADPALGTTGRGEARAADVLRATRDALAGRGVAEETIWLFLGDDELTAHVGDARHRSGLADAEMSPAELRRALAARVGGAAPSVAAGWERRAEDPAGRR